MKQRLWLGALIVVAGAIWGFAQMPGTTPAPTTPAPTAPALTPAPTAADPAERFYGPEIWRLPPVSSSLPSTPLVAPTPSPAVPQALTVPPAETIPTPTPMAPITNAPASLSGVLSTDEPIKIKPTKPDANKLWDGNFDLGLDGSEGNSETYNFHFGFHANRKTESNILTLGLDYNKTTAQTIPTANRMFFDGRFEWLIRQTRWSWFVHETVEYDEFQPFNVRDTSDAGLGYRLIKNDSTTFIGRLGSGFSHEYGGPENGEYFPELVFGLQLEQQISKRQKVVGIVEYAPDIGDFDRYRIRTQAAWDLLLDEEKNLSLRMGVLERYNSVPNGARPNDLDYALMLMWKF